MIIFPSPLLYPDISFFKIREYSLIQDLVP
jgi:hypothetical protein